MGENMKNIYIEKPKEYIAFQYTDGNEQELKKFFEDSDIDLDVYLRSFPNTLEVIIKNDSYNKMCCSLYRNDWLVYCMTTDSFKVVKGKLFDKMFEQTNGATI